MPLGDLDRPLGRCDARLDDLVQAPYVFSQLGRRYRNLLGISPSEGCPPIKGSEHFDYADSTEVQFVICAPIKDL